MKRMIMSAHGIQRFEITNPVHVPRKGDTICYSDNKFEIVDIIYDYDGDTIFVYCRLL